MGSTSDATTSKSTKNAMELSLLATSRTSNRGEICVSKHATKELAAPVSNRTTKRRSISQPKSRFGYKSDSFTSTSLKTSTASLSKERARYVSNRKSSHRRSTSQPKSRVEVTSNAFTTKQINAATPPSHRAGSRAASVPKRNVSRDRVRQSPRLPNSESKPRDGLSSNPIVASYRAERQRRKVLWSSPSSPLTASTSPHR
mmetsp:Transcript_16660/g.35176  ORF Transcript_16660/g.35176 Transcript_16660/m.35176 type:complete len:201 (-) Transcript_16660:13-615(-)